MSRLLLIRPTLDDEGTIMIRATLLAATLSSLLLGCGGNPGGRPPVTASRAEPIQVTAPAPVLEFVSARSPFEVEPGRATIAPESRAEIYRAARSALADARNRAAGRDLSIRKQATVRMTELALNSVAARFALKRYELDRIVAQGERDDGTASLKAKTAAVIAAKARVQRQLDAVNAAQIRAMNQPPINPEMEMLGRLMINRAMRGSASSGHNVSSRTLHIGPRGGVYTISPNGNKVYQKR